MKLYTYYRSSAAYRIRIALHYKSLSFDAEVVDLLAAKQKSDSYKTVNPQARVPSLQDGDMCIGQSMAILEYLEEKYPEPSLLPTSLEARAQVRFLANIVACDMHPMNNSGTINYLKNTLSQDEATTLAWYHFWLDKGFSALEALVAPQSKGKFCVGDTLSLADVCLIPQIYNAKRFGFDMTAFPTLAAIDAHCLQLDCVQQALPENQADCPD